MIDIRQQEGGLTFRVLVSPSAKRTSVGGLHDGALRVFVTAAPDKGKANAAVIKAVAEALDVRRSQLQVVSGHLSRRKTLLVDNETLISITKKLQALVVTDLKSELP